MSLLKSEGHYIESELEKERERGGGSDKAREEAYTKQNTHRQE